jgi:hypothetical protein
MEKLVEIVLKQRNLSVLQLRPLLPNLIPWPRLIVLQQWNLSLFPLRPLLSDLHPQSLKANMPITEKPKTEFPQDFP